MRRLAAAATCVGTILVGVASCSGDATTGDFKDQGEDFIDDEEEIETFAGTDVTDTECEEPADVEIGTTYACSSTGADGTTWRWEVEIVGENELRVQGGEPQE